MRAPVRTAVLLLCVAALVGCAAETASITAEQARAEDRLTATLTPSVSPETLDRSQGKPGETQDPTKPVGSERPDATPGSNPGKPSGKPNPTPSSTATVDPEPEVTAPPVPTGTTERDAEGTALAYYTALRDRDSALACELTSSFAKQTKASLAQVWGDATAAECKDWILKSDVVVPSKGLSIKVEIKAVSGNVAKVYVVREKGSFYMATEDDLVIEGGRWRMNGGQTTKLIGG